jgi:hypothetical protein
MAQASKTFRIFVSSTFSDLKEERNALQKYVFPKLRELCMQHGCRFQAIDLRWGVREEAALDQQTMKICLEEIARCQRVTSRPNFIALLGDRYGWRPLPWEIPAREFEEIERRVTDADDKALLERWYRRDDNAVLPVYCLQPREGEFANFEKWEAVECRLRSTLLQATAGMNLTPDERLKYTASATEQEIIHGAWRVPDALDDVPDDVWRSVYEEMDSDFTEKLAYLKQRTRQLAARRMTDTSPSIRHDLKSPAAVPVS